LVAEVEGWIVGEEVAATSGSSSEGDGSKVAVRVGLSLGWE